MKKLTNYRRHGWHKAGHDDVVAGDTVRHHSRPSIIFTKRVKR